MLDKIVSMSVVIQTGVISPTSYGIINNKWTICLRVAYGKIISFTLTTKYHERMKSHELLRK